MRSHRYAAAVRTSSAISAGRAQRACDPPCLTGPSGPRYRRSARPAADDSTGRGRGRVRTLMGAFRCGLKVYDWSGAWVASV